ncbi:unnamed protein product [Alopecurus aequalis]
MDAGGGDGNGICFPYDVLVDILRRLPSRALAGSRRVCSAWRAIVDGHGLLFPHYFPGIFVTKIGCESDSAFFAPLSAKGRDHAADGPVFRRPVFPQDWAKIQHSCNGLLLLGGWGGHYVCNPATVRCIAPLPPPPMPPTRRAGAMFLAFDPAVSLHYEVFFFQEEVPPRVPEPPTWVDLEQPHLPRLFGEEQSSDEEQDDNTDLEQSCLPNFIGMEQGEGDEPDHKTETNKEHFGFPIGSDELEDKSLMPSSKLGEVSPLVQLQEEGFEGPKEKVVSFTVYSSRTGKWENRPSKGTYDMVELPGEPCGAKGWYTLPTKSVLASYERGIHYVAIDQLRLQVWMLTKSADGQLGWTQSHKVNLDSHSRMADPLTITPKVTWGVVERNKDKLISLFEDSYHGESIHGEENSEDDMTDDGVDEKDEDGDEAEELRSIGGSEQSWNSDKDNFIDLVEDASHLVPSAWPDCKIMGFHPYKCALVLQLMRIVVVYHLDTSRMQYLGDAYELTKDSRQPACCAYGSFPYRPCYMDVLPARRSSVPS